ncbi:MAG: cytochrome C oxidase subunit IV family protein [Moritella sp.]|uniref:cytochrome C oxidase subunit IV family protein n=1 Tax=Moritella sp. TaxID=78556 RepID=UPI0029B93239|nr:cytochrome C oxidase subunit IV family protein [Moritella sp.]MDX2319747.1 cytochrome C oxidase subunit IV family protein [Moritella sp.]
MEDNITVKKQIIVMSYVWLALIVMSVVAFALSLLGIDKSYLIAAVMLLTIVKAKLITGVFMELNIAPKIWQRGFNSYIVIIPVVTALAYGLA